MSNQNRVSAGVPAGGQFAQSTRGEAGVALSEIAEPEIDPRFESWELEGIDQIIEDTNEKMEEPEHYSEDDIAAMEKKVEDLDKRQRHLLAKMSPDPRVRFNALADEQNHIRRETAQAAVDSAIETVKEEHPGATHLVLGYSDQGDYATFDGVINADGSYYANEYLDDADYAVEDYTGWLSMEDPRDDWSERTVEETPNDDINGLLKARNVKVIKIG